MVFPGVNNEGFNSKGYAMRGFPPPGTSPLSPLPSPSHRPGEGDLAEAVQPIGCFSASLPFLITHPTNSKASVGSPSPGWWEGDGRGDRGEVPGGYGPGTWVTDRTG